MLKYSRLRIFGDRVLSTAFGHKGWRKVYNEKLHNVCSHQTIFSFSVALQSLKNPVRLTRRRFLELFRHMVGLLGRVISLSQGLYLHRTTQHGKTRTNIHALSGIRTHDPSNKPAKTHASDRTAIVTGIILISRSIIIG
jgi:hypothetical protein